MALPFWERIYVVYYREGGMLYLRCKCIQGETRLRAAFLYSPLKPIREWKRRYKFAHKTICVCITNMQLPLVPAPINRIIRGEGRMCFLILVGWKLHARFKSKGREGYQAEGEGRRERNNELSVCLVLWLFHLLPVRSSGVSHHPMWWRDLGGQKDLVLCE